MEHLLEMSKCTIFHNIFKYMIFQRPQNAILWSKWLINFYLFILDDETVYIHKERIGHRRVFRDFHSCMDNIKIDYISLCVSIVSIAHAMRICTYHILLSILLDWIFKRTILAIQLG